MPRRFNTSSISSPFGSSLPNRAWSDVSRGYRYGFNGKEKDTETANDNYDFGARVYDGRLGRWLSLDKLNKVIVYVSGYCTFNDNPNLFMDLDGNIPVPPVTCQIMKDQNDLKDPPKCVGDLAKCTMSVTYKIVEDCVVFDIKITKHYYQYLNDILAVNGESENGSLHNYFKHHEEAHQERFIEAAKLSYSYTYNGTNYSGSLNDIATTIYKDLKLDTYLARKDAIVEDYKTKMAAALEMDDNNKQYNILREERDKKLEEIILDFNKNLTTFNEEYKLLEDIFIKKSDELNNHDGPGGVIEAAIDKATSTKEKDWDKTEIINLDNEVLNNCHDF